MKKLLITAAGATLIASSATAGGAFYNLGAGVTPYGVTNGGAVASGYNTTQYVYWTPGGGVTTIGGTAPGGGVGGQGKVSNDGMRISGTIRNPSNANLAEMGYYDRGTGTWNFLGGIGGVSGTETSSGWGISGDGRSVVGLGWVSAGSANAIQWTEGGSTVSLGTTVPGRSTRANAADFDGNTIVGWQDGTTGFRQAAVWNSGVQSLIWTDAAQTQPASEASNVSGNGNWVVGSGNSSNGQQPWLWSAGTGFMSLGHLNAAWRGASTAVTDSGVVVGFDRPFPGPATFGQGFIWTQANGMINLNTYATSLGINTGGVTLALPLAISADGSAIAGVGSGGVGWVLVIPEPSGLVLLALAALAIRRR